MPFLFIFIFYIFDIFDNFALFGVLCWGHFYVAISLLSPLYQNLSEVRCTMYASNFSDLAPSGASWLRLNSAYARFGSDQEDNPK